MLRFLALLFTAALLVPALTAVDLSMTPAPARAAEPRRVDYREWHTPRQLAWGRFVGTRVSKGALVVSKPVGRGTNFGRRYEWGHWLSPWVDRRFSATELIPSWSARTPGASWIRVSVRGVTTSGVRTGWDHISRWAAEDRVVKRQSYPAQTDGRSRVSYDTWKVPDGLARWQVRVTLVRPAGVAWSPRVRTIGAVTSRLPSTIPPTSRPIGVGTGKELRVPRYSQMIHRGEYPQYGGGGEAWCSPTATSMVLGYYDALPPPRRYRWVRSSYPHRFVAYAARQTFDHSFDGTGNWPFNTAYASTWVHHAFVTRFPDLRPAERLIASGIPVVASVAWGSGQLDGAPISASNGHLLVIVGFTTAGNPIVNDPAAPNNASVRRVYRRDQFEAAWLRGSGGVGYVIRDGRHPLPPKSPLW